MSAQNAKPIRFGTITTSQEFENFEGLHLRDGSGSGFELEDDAGGTATFTNITIGGTGTKLCTYVKVTGTDVHYALFQ